MGWDSGSGTLTKPFTKIAANGQGDLQLALGRTGCFDHIQLLLDIDGNGVAVNKLNIKSKYKPFRSSTVAFSGSGDGSDRELALQMVNLGYSTPSYQNLEQLFAAAVAAGQGNTLWSWNKPVLNTHPLRALDMDGYAADADWPFQVGITPNPAYYNSRMANAIEVSDADAGAALASWDKDDLKMPITTVGGQTVTIADDLDDDVFLAVAWAPVGTTIPTGAYTLTGGRYPLTGISADATYNVVAFFTNIEYTGNYIQTSGVHIPVPLSCSAWEYHNKLPFMDRGSYILSGELFLHLRMEVLQTIIYTYLGIQFSNDGSTWSSNVTIYSSSGTLTRGSMLSSDRITLPGAYTNPTYFRLVWGYGSSTYPDPQRYSPQSSPTD